jgi:Protein of unknown function (DUF3999)
MNFKILYFLPFCLFSVSAFAQMKDYSHKCELRNINAQWHKIKVPTSVFEHAKSDLSDLRIFGITTKNDTIEAPYLIKIAKAQHLEKALSFNLLNQSSNEKGRFYTFEMPKETTINELNLSFENPNFDWKIQVEGSQNQTEWFSIVNDYRILSIKNAQTDFQFTKVSMPDSKFKYIRVLVKTADKIAFSSANIALNEEKSGDWIDYKLLSIKKEEDKKAKQSLVFLELANAAPIALLKIKVQSAFDYYRPIRIEYLSDSAKTPKGWLYTYSPLASGTLNSLDAHEFGFESTKVRKLKITIENDDNKPLDLDSFAVSGYAHELTARFLDAATYFLCYGNKNANTPQYDIAQFSDQIPADISMLQLGDAQQNGQTDAEPKTQALFENKAWLWAIMALVIGLLAWFSLKMMRNTDDL